MSFFVPHALPSVLHGISFSPCIQAGLETGFLSREISHCDVSFAEII